MNNEYIDAYNQLHEDCSNYYLESNYKIQPSIMNFYIVFDYSGDCPRWVKRFYGLRKAVKYILLKENYENKKMENRKV